jgi:hypothetical protein
VRLAGAETKKGGGDVALVTRFEDLKVWQEARALTKKVYGQHGSAAAPQH